MTMVAGLEVVEPSARIVITTLYLYRLITCHVWLLRPSRQIHQSIVMILFNRHQESQRYQ